LIGLLQKGYKALWQYKWLVLLLYIVNALYGILIGTKVKSAITSALGNSAAGKEIETGYDSDIFTDLLTHEGLNFSETNNIIVLGLPVFLLLGILVKGGIIATISNGENGLTQTIKNGGKYFMKNLGITIFVFICLLLAFAFIWVPYITYSVDLNRFVESIFDNYETEKPFIIGLAVLFLLTVILSIIAASWRTRSLSLLVNQDPRYIKKGFQYAIGNALRIIPFSILLLVIGLLFSYFFKYLTSYCNSSTLTNTICMIALGQFVIIGYCKLRLMFFGAIVNDN